jgi:hypothetical protein
MKTNDTIDVTHNPNNSTPTPSPTPTPSTTTTTSTTETPQHSTSHTPPTHAQIREKFKGFLEQYELREKHFETIVKSHTLELKLLDAKLETQRKVAAAESVKVGSLKAQVAAFLKTEKELRRQLLVYVEKFKQVCGGCLLLFIYFLFIFFERGRGESFSWSE